MSRLEARGAASCQYALVMLRWLGRAPEDFLTGEPTQKGEVRLPTAGRDSRLRWNLNELHAALDAARRQEQLTWTNLAGRLGCTPSRLTGLHTATFADLEQVMRVTQWLKMPAAEFIHAEHWRAPAS
ncbi:MAG TPA: hypothetical protein PK020_00085 [Ilumatobacteraceae bacterium]|nr:hypothetical protein [Ilumatobacteraceae bacterium]